MYTPFTPPVPAEAERSRARVPTLAPGGACLMTSHTKNEPASPLDFALTKSLDLKPFEINTYKKRGWALRDHELGRQRSADAKEVEEAKQAESFQQKYCTVPSRLGICSPSRVAYKLVDVGVRSDPVT